MLLFEAFGVGGTVKKKKKFETICRVCLRPSFPPTFAFLCAHRPDQRTSRRFLGPSFASVCLDSLAVLRWEVIAAAVAASGNAKASGSPDAGSSGSGNETSMPASSGETAAPRNQPVDVAIGAAAASASRRLRLSVGELAWRSVWEVRF